MNTNLVQIQDEKNEAQGLDQNHTRIQAGDLKKFERNLNTKNNCIMSHLLMIILKFRFYFKFYTSWKFWPTDTKFEFEPFKRIKPGEPGKSLSSNKYCSLRKSFNRLA